jgi:hypothetical protein
MFVSRRCPWILGLLLALAPLSSAHAQAVDRPLRVGLGIGPAFVIDGGAQFLIVEDIDYRFLDSDLGSLFVGVELGEGISGSFFFNFGVRAGYDFRVFHNDVVEILVAPEILVGAAVAAVQGAQGFFDLQFGAEARAVFLDGLLAAWVRPFAFDIFIQERTVARYDLLFGASVQF